MAVAKRKEAPPLPRLAPRRPRKTLLDAYVDVAADTGLSLFDWQYMAAEYMTATDRGRRWKWPEVCVVVARQNGKTELLLPRVAGGLWRGERIVHTAQIRTLPRKLFLRIARYFEAYYPAEVDEVRRANGQEEIILRNGGSYAIVAAQRGARGESTDTLIIDEVREFEDFDLVAAAAPTLTASPNPQTIYLSNAGHEGSVVLNDLRRRRDTDKRLAYLEWSAHPDRSVADVAGWMEANPSPLVTVDRLAEYYARLPLPVFETEHLCRWVSSMQPRLVDETEWLACRKGTEAPVRPFLGISVDPTGRRASACIAWPQGDGRIALAVLADVTGEPIDLDAFGADLAKASAKLRVQEVAFDPWTDQHLARLMKDARPLQGREYANASERFARLVEAGRLTYADADAVTTDLPYTVRKLHDVGAWHAAKARDDRPITASLAAVRAVWLAAAPRPALPKVY